MEDLLKELDETRAAKDPFQQFDRWFEDAVNAGIRDANAMTLATASRDGSPAARIVLLKGSEKRGFVFFSNYESRKGRELTENPRAALLFFWPELERQVRIEGIVEIVSRGQTEEYFASRPLESRIGAWASRQSRIISGRDFLEGEFKKYQSQFSSGAVPVPDYWGGYRLVPSKFEFWQGRPNRLHDRIEYLLKGSSWSIQRLSP
jgi:pyridoxamine 5'-phosphate oxidase